MKTLIKSIVYKESPLYLYGHGPFKTHNKIFFNHDAYFELETNTLVSDHSSGFGANLFTLLGPLMFLAHRNIFPSSIKTFVGFKNFMDKSTNEPLKDLFIAPQTLRAQSTELRPPSFRPYYLNVCYYLNPWGNYKRITFCPLLTFVLDRYFTPKKELFDKADRFFKDKGIEPSSSMSVFIRGCDRYSDATIPSINEVTKVTRKYFKNNNSKTIIFHTDDISIATKVMERLKDLPIILCDILPLKESNFTHQLPQPGMNALEAGQRSLVEMLIMAKVKNLITHVGGFSLWTILLRRHTDNMFNFKRNGHIKNPLYVRALYHSIQFLWPEKLPTSYQQLRDIENHYCPK